jgi:membrane-associated phospholipid phosphatase
MQLGPFWMVSVTGIVAWLLTRRAGPTLGAVLAVTGAWLLPRVVKDQVGRARPDELLAGVDVRGPEAARNAYESGHSAVAFARVYVGVHLRREAVGGGGGGLLCGRAAPPRPARAVRPSVARVARAAAGAGRLRASR